MAESRNTSSVVVTFPIDYQAPSTGISSNSTATPDAQATGSGLAIQGTVAKVMAGATNPNGKLNAPNGSLFLREGGSNGHSAYLKEANEGTNTGWLSLSGDKQTNVICDGDSLTVGYPISTATPQYSYPNQMAGRIVNVPVNLGQNGHQSSDVIATHIPIVDSLYDPLRTNVYCLIIGRNDLAGVVTLSTLQSNVTSIVSGRHAVGFKVIVGTILPSNLAGQPVGFEANRQAYNAWLVSGSSGADLVCDVGSDPIISDTTNTFYYQSDQVHMTAAGYAVVAINFAASVQRVVGSGFCFQPINPFGTVLPKSVARDPNYKDCVSIYDFGAVSNATSATNTLAIQRAIAAAVQYGLPVVMPETSYKIQRTNLWAFGTTSPVTLLSRAIDPSSNGHGTRLICDGTGPSWLRAALNVSAPNSGNTATDWTQQMHGLVMKGIYVDQAAGISSNTLSGIWLAHVWDFLLEDCGAVLTSGGAWRSGIETWSCTAGVLRRPRAITCSAGIALNGGASDTQPTMSSSIMVEHPDCENCTSAGITFQYASGCKVLGGFLVNNAVGAYGSGSENTLTGTYFASNTKDVDMIQAAAPWDASTVSPDQMRFMDCHFTSSVNIKSSFGTTLMANYFASTSSLAIAATATQTALFQHNSFPNTAFTDLGVATYLASVVVGASSPAGGPGMLGQRIYDKTHAIDYICTLSGIAGTAVWTAMATGGGSGVTSLNTLTGAMTLAASTGLSVASAGTTVTYTNTAPFVAPGSLTSYTCSVTAGAGSVSASSTTAAWAQSGKWVFVRIYARCAQSTADTPNFQFTLPATPKFTGSNGYQVQALSVSVLNILGGVLPSVGLILNSTSVGAAAATNYLNGQTYDCVVSGWYEAN